jgi:hypothetical protein
MANVFFKSWGAVMAGGTAFCAVYGSMCEINVNFNKTLKINDGDEKKYKFNYKSDSGSLTDRTKNALVGSVCGAIAFGPLLPLTSAAAIRGIYRNMQ